MNEPAAVEEVAPADKPKRVRKAKVEAVEKPKRVRKPKGEKPKAMPTKAVRDLVPTGRAGRKPSGVSNANLTKAKDRADGEPDAGPALLAALAKVNENQTVLARALGTTAQTIWRSQARARNSKQATLAPRFLPRLAAISGVSVHEMNPDAYLASWKVKSAKVKVTPAGVTINGILMDEKSNPIDC